jgi:hypothetical protein
MSRRAIATLSISVALLIACSWVQPAQAVTPRQAQVRVSKQQPRVRFFKRVQVNVKRFWSTTRKRSASWMRGLSAPRPAVKDPHLQPLKRMLRSGRLSQTDYDRAMTALGHKPPVDPAKLARQRLEHASQQNKHLRPLVRMIQRGELSNADVVRMERVLNR